MKVILLKDIKGTGKKDQVIEVSDGFGRNYLLPRKLAVEATADNINAMKLRDQAKAAQLAKEKAEAQKVAAEVESKKVVIQARAGSSGKLFGAVTAKEISEALKAQHGLDIAKQKIILAEPIKSYGSYEVKCKLGFEISCTLHVTVTEQV
mgnify:CR=1 FL=1